MQRIIIEVSGGVVTSVHTEYSSLVCIVDHDNRTEGEEDYFFYESDSEDITDLIDEYKISE